MSIKTTEIKGWIGWGQDYQTYTQGEYNSEWECEGEHEETVGCDCMILYGANEDDNTPLVKLISDELERAEYKVSNNRRVSVTISWHVSDVEMSLEELQIDAYKQVTGIADYDFGHHFSDLTGYLWTDETLVVNGHDVFEEIASVVGDKYSTTKRKYLYMQINYHVNTMEEMIEEWHNVDTDMKVHQYLGITKKEYDSWVENPNNTTKSWR